MADFPAALGAPASLALQPRFRAVPDIAGQEVTAGGALQTVGIRQRRDRTARTGGGIFPGNAGIPSERLAHHRTGGGKVAIVGRGGDGLRASTSASRLRANMESIW